MDNKSETLLEYLEKMKTFVNKLHKNVSILVDKNKNLEDKVKTLEKQQSQQLKELDRKFTLENKKNHSKIVMLEGKVSTLQASKKIRAK